MTKNFIMVALVSITLLSLCVAGCKKGRPARPTGTVSGTVSWNGSPLKLGDINFKDDVTGTGLSTKLDSSGHYTFTDPVPAASYKVSIVRPTVAPDEQVTPEIKKFPVPDKFADTSTSGLTAEVKTGENTIDFNLKK